MTIDGRWIDFDRKDTDVVAMVRDMVTLADASENGVDLTDFGSSRDVIDAYAAVRGITMKAVAEALLRLMDRLWERVVNKLI